MAKGVGLRGFVGPAALLFAILCSAGAWPAQAQQSAHDEQPEPLEVPIRPRGGQAPIVSFDDVYVDLGDGVIVSFGEWMRRTFGAWDLYSDDPLAAKRLTGAVVRGWAGATRSGADPARIQPERVGEWLGPRYVGRSFINIGADLGYDPEKRRPGLSRGWGIYAPPVVAPLTPAEFELGRVSFGHTRLSDVVFD